MSIISTQHNRENPYVMIPREMIEDIFLSLEAKGLFCYLLCHEEKEWERIISEHPEDEIKPLLDELIELGYLSEVSQ